MTEDQFSEYISKLWSMIMWGNKSYVIKCLLEDNEFEVLKKELADLLYGGSTIENRWDHFVKSIKGLGPATMSELLTYVNPQEYVIFNKTTVLCMSYLDVLGMPKYNYQCTGAKYAEICAEAKKTSKAMAEAGAEDIDLLAVDYFLWDEVLPLAEKKVAEITGEDKEPAKPITKKESKSLHDEIKEKLVSIGALLGFESRAEVHIATGAVVDAVWEAKLAIWVKPYMLLKCSQAARLIA